MYLPYTFVFTVLLFSNSLRAADERLLSLEFNPVPLSPTMTWWLGNSARWGGINANAILNEHWTLFAGFAAMGGNSGKNKRAEYKSQRAGDPNCGYECDRDYDTMMRGHTEAIHSGIRWFSDLRSSTYLQAGVQYLQESSSWYYAENKDDRMISYGEYDLQIWRWDVFMGGGYRFLFTDCFFLRTGGNLQAAAFLNSKQKKTYGDGDDKVTLRNGLDEALFKFSGELTMGWQF